MRVTHNILKRIIQDEMSRLVEGCGEASLTGSPCSDCAAGHECPCGEEDDLGDSADFEDFSALGSSTDDDTLSKDEALRIVWVIAQNTSCSVTRAALINLVDDLAGEGEEEDVDVDWDNPQYGQFKGDIEDLESKDAAFGTGFAMGQSGDFDAQDDVLIQRPPGSG